MLCGLRNRGHNISKLTNSKPGEPSLESKNGAGVTYLDPSPKVGKTKAILEKYNDTYPGYLRVSVSSWSFFDATRL